MTKFDKCDKGNMSDKCDKHDKSDKHEVLDETWFVC